MGQDYHWRYDMNFVLAFIAFNVIVIVHELGHFIAAKKFGIKVEEFSLFVGPKLFSIQRGETMYSLRLIPIMAYVKMEGEEQASESERAFNNKPKYARALTAFGGPLANLVLAAILLTIVFSLQGFATTGITEVDKGSPAEAAGIQPGDVITGYNGISTYMPLDVIQFLYVSKGKPAEIEYTRNNIRYKSEITPKIIPEANSYKLGVVFNASTGAGSNAVQSVTPGYPAEKVGLRAGDKIVKMDDTDISDRQQLVAFLDKSKNKEVTVTVLRNNSEIHVNITPKMEKVPEQYDLGVAFNIVQGNLWDSFREAAIFTYSIVRSVVYSIVWLITGQVQLNQMMGPIGMVSTIGSAVQQGPNLMAKLIYLLQMTGLMSIAIGATNLIPFPMLDGNRLVLIGVEAIRGRPIKPEKEAFISMVGFVLIIMIAIYAAYNDIMRLING